MELAEGRTSFLRSLRIQLRIIGALLMREIITRYGRHNVGFVWLFLEPMIFTLGVTALWYGFGISKHSNLPVVAFGVTGYSSVLLWRNCATRASMAIPPNTGLLYHRNVRVLDLLWTRILLEIAGASVSFVVLTILFVSIGWCEMPQDMLKVFGGWLLLTWFGTALALAIGAMTSFSDLFERLWAPAAYLLFPLSGAVFMVEWLPRHFQEVVLWLPMVHGLELLREGYMGPVIRTHYDVAYVVSVCLVLTLIGLAVAKDAARRIHFQ